MSFTVALPRFFRPVEQRAFALSDMVQWGYQGLRSQASQAGEDEARGIPALTRAARIRSEALAGLRLRCYSGEGVERIARPTVWQAKLFSGPANGQQTRFCFWDAVGESLAWRNNAWIWKNVDPLTGQVVEWYALHPDQVRLDKRGRWQVVVESGYVDPVGKGRGEYTPPEGTILHIRGHGGGGLKLAPTLIELYRAAVSAPVGRMAHENKMWRRGTTVQQAILFPPGVNMEQADQWKELYRSAYEGAGGETTVVLGGGPDIKPIGMTAVDAAYVEMADLTVKDASMIMGVPENLLRQTTRPVPNLEQDVDAFLRFGLGPELYRIESALEADEQLFGGAQTYPRFDTDMFVRGDVQTEAEVLVKLVQAGILTPNEARAVRGLDDLGPEGDVPQVTPVGGAPNPMTTPPPPVPVGANGASSEQ